MDKPQGMVKVANTRELPWQPVRCFAIPEADAAKLATEYATSWFYPLPDNDNGYFYVLDSEWQEKQREKSNKGPQYV